MEGTNNNPRPWYNGEKRINIMTTALAEKVYRSLREVKTPTTKAAKTLPILSHVRIYTDNGEIHFQAVDTSGETWELVTSKAAARVEQQFDTCVPMRPFRDWLKVTAKYNEILSISFNDKVQFLTFETDPLRTGTKSRTTFKCIDALEFPSNLPLKGQPHA